MRKMLFVCLCFMLLSAGATAEGAEAAEVNTTDFNFGLYTEPVSPMDVKGVRFNFIYGNARNVSGLSLGMVNSTQGILKGVEYGFVNLSGDITGGQWGFVNIGKGTNGVRAAFVNILEGDATGVVTGFVNNVRNVTGGIAGFVNNAAEVRGASGGFVNRTQAVYGGSAGFVNLNEGAVNGVAVGFVNVAKEVNGVATGFVNVAGKTNGLVTGYVNIIESTEGLVDGFVNIAGKADGLMVGFVNICDGLDGAALGFVNILKGGFGKVSVYSTTENLYNVAFKSGRGFYGILGAGYDTRETTLADRYTLTAGMGYHGDLKPFFVDLEAVGNAHAREINRDFDYKTAMYASAEVRVLPGITIGDLIDIYAGPSVKYYTEGDVSKRSAWNWNGNNLRFSAVAGINLRVF